MIVLAHLSDLHIAPLPRPRLAELMSKRVVGFANWLRKRRYIHRTEVLSAIVDDLKANAPDHIAVTGDLINISLREEFAPGTAWLARLGPPENVTFVPGNHDIYVPEAVNWPAQAWGAYMRADGAGDATPVQFPFVRKRGPIALIGLSAAVPTAPLMATGRVGDEQLARLAPILDELKQSELFRVVLIHYPPRSVVGSYHKRLVDAEELRRVLKMHGAELVLHGHDHIRSVVALEGPAGTIPAVGVSSASALRGDRDMATYNLYRISGAAGAWQCEMITRGLDATQRVVELKRQNLI